MFRESVNLWAGLILISPPNCTHMAVRPRKANRADMVLRGRPGWVRKGEERACPSCHPDTGQNREVRFLQLLLPVAHLQRERRHRHTPQRKE